MDVLVFLVFLAPLALLSFLALLALLAFMPFLATLALLFRLAFLVFLALPALRALLVFLAFMLSCLSWHVRKELQTFASVIFSLSRRYKYSRDFVGCSLNCFMISGLGSILVHRRRKLNMRKGLVLYSCFLGVSAQVLGPN